jgi:hypothetical protein
MTAIAVDALRGGVGLWSSRRSQRHIKEFLEELRDNLDARLGRLRTPTAWVNPS